MISNSSASGFRPLAFVTGGASGIGLAVTRHLASLGWEVIAADMNEEALRRLQLEADSAQGSGLFRGLKLDISDETSVKAVFESMDCSRLRGVVNSAGIGQSVPFLETGLDLLRRTIEVNLIGTFLVSQIAARAMVESGGGSIVNISSGSALRGNAGRAAYGASKGGVEVLTKVMSVELAKRGVRVNTVAPGPIETPLVLSMHSAEDRSRALRSVPQGRYGRAEDVAKAVAFLLDGDQSAYITGCTLAVDGGFASAGSFNITSD
ncbi:MAG: SDR family oxidoreductase [Ottowia sp.]|uniref:SDR family NAD(P)-dependent oxidoreductase n=1 Tax=Ottowia sp. TaxID=1898956 RepID=UPI0039E5BB59